MGFIEVNKGKKKKTKIDAEDKSTIEAMNLKYLAKEMKKSLMSNDEIEDKAKGVSSPNEKESKAEIKREEDEKYLEAQKSMVDDETDDQIDKYIKQGKIQRRGPLGTKVYRGVK